LTGEAYSIRKYIKIIFYAFVSLILAGFICAQIVYPSERDSEASEGNFVYEGILFWEKADGTKEQIASPGNYDVEPGEVMVISTILPEDYSENSIGIRGSQQTVRFYIEGELRSEYDTSGSRPFGSNSASRYVFCKTSAADAGKQLRIELKSNSKRYSGVVNQILCGDKTDIWSYIFSIYGGETVVACFILFAGIVTVLFSIALSIAYKSKINMVYLGWCMILGAAWLLGESKLRQLFVSNASSLASLCFIVVMLCPVPISLYVDSVQRGRYENLQYIRMRFNSEPFTLQYLAVCGNCGLSGYAFCFSYYFNQYFSGCFGDLFHGFSQRKNKRLPVNCNRVAACHVGCCH